jgi:tetratricopeptide (TPR) repeat protein
MKAGGRWTWGGAALIAGAGALAYANSFAGPFLFDDPDAITRNPSIQPGWTLAGVLQGPMGNSASGRPLLNLSLALNQAVSGAQVWSYHALNLLIHLAAALVLFGLVRRTLQRIGWAGAQGAALAAALLWTLHPVQTESVTYVIQRAESLMGLCYLLTLYGLARYAGEGGKAWAGLCLAACFLGMAAKEVMVTAPFIVLLYDRAFFAGSFREAWRRRAGLYLGLAASWLVLLFLLVRMGGSRAGTIGFGVAVPWWRYALTQFPAVAHYLRLSVWPYPLVLDYGAAWVRSPGEVLPFVPVVAALVAGTLYALVRFPRAGFLGCWFLVILAPTSSVIPGIRQTIAEHRMYLPLAAVLVALVLAVQRLLAWAWPRRAGPAGFALCMMAAAAAGAATFARNRDYRSSLTIWTDTVRRRPDNAYAHYNLGFALADAGRFPEAVREDRTAVQLDPTLAEGHEALGLALAGNGQLDEGVAEDERALQLQPAYPEGEFNLANALAQKGDLPGAIGHFQRALALRPDFPPACLNLGNALLQSGRTQEAVRQYRAALRLQPGYADAQNNLAVALRALAAAGPPR